MKKYFCPDLPKVLLLLLFSVVLSFAQTKKNPQLEMDFDEAGEDDRLNRELWERVKRTSYEKALDHIEIKRKQIRQTGNVMLPNGWQIAPAGEQTEVGRLPFEAVSFSGQTVVLNTGYYSREQQEVSVVNPRTLKLVKVLHLDGLFPSAVVGQDENLYISGGFSRKIYRYNKNFESTGIFPVNGYASGLAVIDADHLAVLYLVAENSPEDAQKGNFKQGKLAILNTKSGKIEREVQVGYYPYSVTYQNNKFFVTVLGENKVAVFDGELKPITTLPTGKTPQTTCVGANRLYVINSGSDDLSVIDMQTAKSVGTISVAWRESRFGSAPTSCTVSNNRLYVTQANTNDVAVFDQTTERLQGFIPTGWYPTKIYARDDQLIILSAKGIRPLRPNVDGPQAIPEKGGTQYVLTLLKGSLAVVPENMVSGKLASWTRLVQNGAPIFNSRQGFKIPIRHIFYIVRENRTYDQVFGDLKQGNGDSYLTMFGREITPNAHKIADEYVTLDNYYANGEISVLGHSFTTSGYASPFLQWMGNMAYSGRYTGYPFGQVPAVTSPKYLWDALDEKKVNYRIYGENYFLNTRAFRILRETFGNDSEPAQKFYTRMMDFAAKVDRGNSFYQFAKPFYGQADTPEDALRLLNNPEFVRGFSVYLIGDEGLVKPLTENAGLRQKFAEYLAHYPSNYRSWDLNISDLERVSAWKTDFEKQIKRGEVAQLNYLWLPNDHTGGIDKRYLPPEQLVAQNDAALGLIIKTISNSPIWKDSLILVTEDDAQNGPDHVDATRTVGMAIGPYVKRNALVRDRYDQLSLLRTIEMLLGLQPLNLSDSTAVPMFGVFTDKPNFEPFQNMVPSKHLSDADQALYQNLEK